MEEGRDSEIPRGENDVKNAGSETTSKFEHLAGATTEEDSNETASGQPVEVQGLTGDTFVLEGCRSIGSVMAKIAMMRSRVADHIVVMDPESGRKMAADDDLVPMVRFVILNEDDVVVDIDSRRLNLLLHAQQGDHVTCARLAKAMERGPRERYEPLRLWRDVITRRDAWAAKTLMRAGFSVVETFLSAAADTDVDDLMFLLSVQPALIEVEDNFGRNTALLLAACEGCTETVEKLLAAGSNIEHANSQGDTALLVAARHSRTGAVEKLLAAGSNIEHVNLRGDTALLTAAYNGRNDIVEKLLAAGSNIEHANSDGDTALLKAARQYYTDTVVKLLAAGSNIEHANSKGNTALLEAGWYHDVVAELLAAGANTAHANSEGNTALLLAVYAGNCDKVAILLAAGSDVEHANSAGNTAFDVNTSRHRPEVAAKLLAARASKTRATNSGDLATLTL